VFALAGDAPGAMLQRSRAAAIPSACVIRFMVALWYRLILRVVMAGG
jgi:hypothetical protein